MQDYFIWNGTDCRQYGIHVTEQPPITIPAERSTQTNVPGRPGSLTQLEGEDVYDDIRNGQILQFAHFAFLLLCLFHTYA